tara:strand:- start:2965 stop:3159 length:195 start_codon:yes stop_codon:yes gene_type:complete
LKVETWTKGYLVSDKNNFQRPTLAAYYLLLPALCIKYSEMADLEKMDYKVIAFGRKEIAKSLEI